MTTYRWNAKDYEDNSKAQQKWARELIKKLSLKGTENILDLGCGDGKVSAEIAGLVSNGSVIGVDNAIPMIELAKTQYPNSGYPNLSFEVMDACNLSFESCFDVVFSNAALHWVKNHSPVVQGLYKSLKPRGKILLQMGGKGNASYILSVLEEIKAAPEWQQYFENFDFPYGFLGIEEYEKMLSQSNFKIDRIELIPKNWSTQENWGWRAGFERHGYPIQRGFPKKKKNNLLKKSLQAILVNSQ